MNSTETRKWAEDMIRTYKATRYEDKALAHAALMIARADLEDAEADREPITAARAAVEYNYPLLGRVIITGVGPESIEHPYDGALADYCEARGIYAAWQWRTDPAAEERCGELIRLYIGSKERGPEAQYNAYDSTWYMLASKGNFGKRYACGGNWSGQKCTGDNTPEIYKKLQEVIMDYKKIEQAKARVKAAEKRVFAAHQREGASAYYRQAAHPIYPGQESICWDKGTIVMALAAQTEAEADLIEAEAGL